MNASFSIASFAIDKASAGRIAWFAADLGIKATLGLLAALAITWGVRRSSAALRHRVWFLTFCGLLVLPIMPLIVPKWQIPLPAAFERIRPQVPQTLPAVAHDSGPADAPNQNLPELQQRPNPILSAPKDDFPPFADAGTIRETERQPTFETPIAPAPAVTTPTLAVAAAQPTRTPHRSAWFYVGGPLAIWLAGAGVALVSIFVARVRGRQLLRSAEPVLDRRWVEPFEQMRESLRITSRVNLLESSLAVVPMATGILRHAVLLPRETEEWPTALRRHVLIHELAHVKRRDVLQHLISSVVTALYWFHPLAWYGMRRMRLEREIACDDCVLMAGEHPCDYAAELVAIARRLKGIATPWAVCMASGSTLEGRVRAMLDRARSHGPLSARAARSLLIAALAAIALLAAVEPGTSSIRKTAPPQTSVADARVADNRGQAKEAPPIVNNPVDKRVLAEANEKPSPKAASKDPTYSFAGTVVDQQKRPVAAAKISLSYFRAEPVAADSPVAVSDARGRFEFSRKKSDLADLYDERYLGDMRVVAIKDGYGFASVPATACEKTGQLAAAIDELKTTWALATAEKGSNVLSLVPDDVPIRGRLLTIDGRAVAGAKVAVVAVWAGENGSLDAFEAKLKESPGWQHLSGLFRGYAQAGAINYLNNKRWYRSAAVRNERRPSIVAAVQSDSDGRFTIKGLGRERMAEILITAPGLETTLRFVRTRRGPVLPMGPERPIPEGLEPSDCSLVLGPSVPIEGRVLDAKTGQALAGVRVQPTNTVFAHALTDAQGRYRIEALPLGNNVLEVMPPKKSPYLPGAVTVETTAGSPRAVSDITLTAGILVHGQAIDERTHQPASGTVKYFAFEPNPLLEKTDSLRPHLTWHSVATDSQGRYEIAALRGPGILGFLGGPDFPQGVGADRIQGSQTGVMRSRFKQFRTVPEPCRPNTLSLVVPLNPRADDREMALDLKLRSAVEVPVHAVAFDGRPLSGECFVQGARDRLPFRRNEGDRFKIVGYVETEARHIVVYYPGQNLVGFHDLSGTPPATLTITLHPAASIAGRVLDEEGLPVPRVQIRCEDTRLVTTDADGRFEIKGIIPGKKYSGRAFPMRREMNRPPFGFADLFTDVTAKEGETKQLGDVRLKQKNPKRREKSSHTPKGTKAATSEPSQQPPGDSKQAKAVTDDTRLRLAARVLDPNGKPVAGASVAIHALLGRKVSGRGFDSVRLGSVSTDSLGRFEYSAELKSIPNFKGGSPKYAAIAYVGTMPGFGLAIGQYSNLSKLPPADIKLVPDETVRGRVLNLEGRPVSGARVDVTILIRDTEVLTKLQQMQSKGIREVFGVWGTMATSPAMLPSATTDADGRFEIRGLGRDRLVNLRIVGPQIAVSLLQVVTRPMPKTEIHLRSRGGGPTGNGPDIFYGSQFEFVAAPGVPVEGTVTDEETGAPIAGVLVASDWLRVPPTVSPHGLISAVSDAKGRFKLEGMPLDDVNTLKVFPLDLPYQSVGPLDVPRGKPPQSISRDIKLRRGVWAVGRVQNVKTGEPVRGRLFYTPFRSNELAKRYARYQSRVRSGFGNDPEGFTDDEGRFRILVIPGRGLVCFNSNAGHYVGGNGAASIPELAKLKSKRGGEGPTYDSFVPTFFDAVREISPAVDAKTVEVNLSVDPGQDVALRIVDPSGKPLAGPLRIGGMNAIAPLGGQNAEKAVVRALAAGETRIVWIKHQATGLTKYLHFTAKPGESERTITLEPPAVLTGRFVSTEGKPYAGWSVDCQYSVGYLSGFPPVRTDSEGRFRCEIPGGGPFDVVSRSGPFVTVASDLTVQSGEQIDFGDLVVNDRDQFVDFTTKVTPKRTRSKEGAAKQLGDPRLKPNEMNAAETPKRSATDTPRLRLAGKVLLPNGAPAAGATVLVEGFVNNSAGAMANWTLVETFSADAHGAFDRELDGRWRPGDWSGVRLSAIMPGYGLSSSIQPRTDKLRSIVLRLADDAPIRARVLNLEGRPVAGVRIETVNIVASKKEWIDRWLAEIPPHPIFSTWAGATEEQVAHMKAVAQTAPAFPMARGNFETVAGFPSAVTNADGKAEIRGLGSERLALLKIVGPGIAAAKVYALTHPTKPIEFNLNPRLVPKQLISIYGSEFEYIAAPGIVVTGVVRDDETKKPISDAIVSSDALSGVRATIGGFLSTTTDIDGRYRLEGLSAKPWLAISVTRPNPAYFESNFEVPRPRLFEPNRKDVTLMRGIVAVGRVYNIKTGQPVLATLFYTPFKSNEFARKTRRSGVTTLLDYVPAGHTDPEGRFRIPVLPGRGVVAVQCVSGDYVPAFGLSKIRELSDSKREIPTFETFSPRWFDAVTEVDLKRDAREVRIDLPVDPGQDVVFKFVDRAGHRQSGARIHGMVARHDGITKTDTITIPATSPDETRVMSIKQEQLDSTQQKEGALCKFIHFKPLPGERERTITLEPPAVLTGRLVSPTGEPLRDVSIDCDYELGYNSVGGFPKVQTDAQGRFRYEIPGGGPFHVASRSGSFFSLARDLSVESGEQVDFGELVVSAGKGIRSTVTAKHPPKRTRSPAADGIQKAELPTKVGS